MKTLSITLSTTLALALTACMLSTPEPAVDAVPFVDLSKRDKPEPVVNEGWREVVIGAPDIDEIGRFWTEIGGFEVREQSEGMMLLGASGVSDWGLIRLIEAQGEVTRPYGSKAWDTGCYFSVMHRAKDLESIVADARAMGWTTLTEDIVYLEFGPSKLHVVVLAHPPTGVQVQLYERLTTPLPDGFPDFERVSAPFNMMQMVRDRDAAYEFYQQGLGFATFFYGPPYRSDVEEVTPIGIPKDLTDEIAYETAITFPRDGMEWGRMEMIAIDADPRLGGKDLSGRCGNPVGIREVVFIDLEDLPKRLEPSIIAEGPFARPGSAPWEVIISGTTYILSTPDGARIVFDPDWKSEDF